MIFENTPLSMYFSVKNLKSNLNNVFHISKGKLKFIHCG